MTLYYGYTTGHRFFRRHNPKSRASGWVTTYGSGSGKRKYTCVACGMLVDSESGKYQQTKHAIQAINNHIASCDAIRGYDSEAREVGRRSNAAA